MVRYGVRLVSQFAAVDVPPLANFDPVEALE